jgi:hypothetical protein
VHLVPPIATVLSSSPPNQTNLSTLNTLIYPLSFSTDPANYDTLDHLDVTKAKWELIRHLFALEAQLYTLFPRVSLFHQSMTDISFRTLDFSVACTIWTTHAKLMLSALDALVTHFSIVEAHIRNLLNGGGVELKIINAEEMGKVRLRNVNKEEWMRVLGLLRYMYVSEVTGAGRLEYWGMLLEKAWWVVGWHAKNRGWVDWGFGSQARVSMKADVEGVLRRCGEAVGKKND